MLLLNFIDSIGEGARRVVTGLFLERGEVEGATVDAGGCAGLEAADCKAECGKVLGGLFSGGFAGAAARFTMSAIIPSRPISRPASGE